MNYLCRTTHDELPAVVCKLSRVLKVFVYVAHVKIYKIESSPKSVFKLNCSDYLTNYNRTTGCDNCETCGKRVNWATKRIIAHITSKNCNTYRGLDLDDCLRQKTTLTAMTTKNQYIDISKKNFGFLENLILKFSICFSLHFFFLKIIFNDHPDISFVSCLDCFPLQIFFDFLQLVDFDDGHQILVYRITTYSEKPTTSTSNSSVASAQQSQPPTDHQISFS